MQHGHKRGDAGCMRGVLAQVYAEHLDYDPAWLTVSA